MNGIAYRNKLLSRGGGKYVMVVDKSLQKSIGFDGQAKNVHIIMSLENLESDCKQEGPVTLSSRIDILTAIKMR